MQYHVDCQCGDSVTVPETAAGSNVRCACGRTVAVPSLRELRRQAGVAQSVSPEMAIETLLVAGKLPEEQHCVLCGTATESSIQCVADCERALVKAGGPSLWAFLLGFFTFGMFGAAYIAAASAKVSSEFGKDRIYPLPLRICDLCRPHLTSPAKLRAAVCRVRLYEELLQKYPDAKLSLT